MVAPKECVKPSQVAAAGKWLNTFHPRHKATSFYSMVNQKNGHQGKKPVLALTVIINISKNGGTRRSGRSGSTMAGRRIPEGPMIPAIREKMPALAG